MINLKNITIRRGARVLLENMTWTIYAKQRIGIIGANGSGKSTLFSLLMQEFSADAGDLSIPRQLKLVHVAQEMSAESKSALDFVLDGDEELRALEQQLLQAEQADDGMRIATLHEQMGVIDAYTAPARAAQLLSGLGFSPSEQQKSVSAFSGGWRVRLNLAKALMTRSDVLLLDEPTNHLDLDAVLWLEQWLIKYPGTLLIISHDRDFLDTTVDHIAHLSHQQLKIYTGNYSAFESLRATELLLQQAVYEKQQKKIAHMQEFVERFRYKASKARQAQSRLKAIERMEVVCAVQSESPFQFQFVPPKQCPNPLLTLEHASIAYGDKTILTNINLSITPKDRIAVLGPNGAGKSSLIKLLAQQLLAAQGSCETAAGLKIGYFAQHQVDQLQLDSTPLLHLKDYAERTPELELRKFLGSFGFSGDSVLTPVNTFSGGEKSRLALALIVWQKPNLLLLDEPTNHLDLEMRNALSLALQEYTGAMILISHDRFLVRTTTDQLYLVANGALQPFDGDLNDYQRWLFDFRKNAVIEDTARTAAKKDQSKQPAKPVSTPRVSAEKIKRLEADLAKRQTEVAQLEALLTDQSLYESQHKDKLQSHLLALSQAQKELEKVETIWLEASEANDLI
ncbi:MAG TPA: ATP-binding cassette domain-containing protein [Gammaproteobacteria bacterium]|jgi:ATP-binding cassette subfamily F protein 3|nr:ATP-binding cassette domain-containing protein [Gammaproteobacteria bacterium]